ncbi:MAG: FAD-dependent monooxygenase [Proteobacteria bacterium]|nr:FAD-dependent monooxygenase [Pseudomonadota bacterium]
MTNRGVIIGGGIAGLAVGLYAQKSSMRLAILEKAPAHNCEDNLLWLAPNGLHLLADLGLLDELRTVYVPQQAMLFSTRNLRELTRLDCQKLTRSNGFPIVAVKRTDLYKLMLRRFLSQGGEVLYEQQLTAISQQDDVVSLSVQGQNRGLDYDYVIAADGIGSTVRRLVFAGSDVLYQEICTYLGHSVTPVAANYIGRTIEAWGTGTRFMLTSLDGKVAYWSAIVRPDVYLKNSAPITTDFMLQLQSTFADYHPDIGRILESAEPTSLHRCNFGVVSGLKAYAAGRICLVGDAAHGMPPNMGQGASLALEDACFLIQSLRQAKTVEEAFIHYDERRRPRAKQMVQIANSMNGTFQPKGRFASAVRDIAAAAFPPGLSQMRMAHLYKVPFSLH